MSRPGSELERLIGPEAFVLLAEAFGGTRLYVPEAMGREHEIVRAIGPDAAKRLQERHSPDYIKVPLAREQRARHYRDRNMTNPQIARKLGITESGVEKLFKRRRDRGEDEQPRLL